MCYNVDIIFGGNTQMRIRIIKTKNTIQYAIIKDIYKNNKRTTRIYENLGTLIKLDKDQVKRIR